MDSNSLNYVNSNKTNEVLNVMKNIITEDLKSFKNTADNIQTYACTIHPHFVVWVNSLVLKNIGGKEIVNNAIEEIFGANDEGNHSMLCFEFFNQLGEYKSQHFLRCFHHIKKIYSFINRPYVIMSFITCNEVLSSIESSFVEDLKKLGVKDFKYIEVHQSADNLEDGHSIKLLKALEAENPPVEDINIGIQLFRDLYLEIFNN